MQTNNGKKGGLLKGKPHYDKNGKPLGGIKAVVTDSGQQVELEGGEVIINKEASKKHWKELSRINQSAGGGVPILPPDDADTDVDSEEFEKGGKIDFNPNKVPSKKIYNYAKKIKEKYPKVWDMGGNIFGNEAYKNLERALKRGYWLDSEDWMFKKWQSFNARHSGDIRIAGIIANLKWLNVVDKGWQYMTNLIEEEIEKKYGDDKMAKGGVVTYRDKYNKKYDYEKGTSHDLDEIADDTGKSKKGLQQIYNKGIGAYKTNPQSVRPNVKSKEQWAMGRVYSAVMGGKASKVDAKELKMEKGGKTNNINCIDFINQSDALQNNGYLYYFKNILVYCESGQSIPNIKSFYLITYNSGGQKNLKITDTINAIELSNELHKIVGSDKSVARILLNEFLTKAKKIDTSDLSKLKNENIIIADRNIIVCNNIKFAKGGELAKGIKVEKEHSKTANKLYNRKITPQQSFEQIAKDHLKEDKHYYSKLAVFENKMADGGNIDVSKFGFKTPTGKPSKLTYLQQILVRTKAFKDWFGDWESVAKEVVAKDLLNNNTTDVVLFGIYKDCSKILDFDTLEPRLVFHGTRSDDEFYKFDTNIRPTGRPYSYFAYNKEYSKNFTNKFGQDWGGMYDCFIQVKNPLVMLGQLFENAFYDGKNWMFYIVNVIFRDKYNRPIDVKKDAEFINDIIDEIGFYVYAISQASGDSFPFWKLMGGDTNGDFKIFLQKYGYDGVIYTEEAFLVYDTNNPAHYTKAVTIFESNQVKLGDGRNVDFSKNTDDIRYKKGGMTEVVNNYKDYTHHHSLVKSIFGDGGNIVENEKLEMKGKPNQTNRQFVEDLIKKMQ